MDLTLSTREIAGAVVITAGGEIDVYTAPKMRDRITAALGKGTPVLVIDLNDVTFLDSTGLGILVGALKKVRAAQGSLRLVCARERLLKIFRITGLEDVFDIDADLETALSTSPQA